MLSLYLGALAFGGTLLVASMVLGAGQKDVSHGDADDAADQHAGADGLAWLPVTSLRFWTFFLAFGGAAGALLTATTSLGAGPVAAAAWGVGWASGVAIVASVKTLRKGSVGSEITPKDLRGETAEVTVALGKDRIGKVRVVAKGRIHDVIAETDDTQLAIGDKVMILGEGAEGRVQVTKS